MLTPRGVMFMQSPCSLHSLHNESELKCMVQPTDNCCCLSLFDLCCADPGMDALVYHLGGPLIYFHSSLGGDWDVSS